MEGIIKKVAVCMCVMALSFGFAGVNCSFGTLSIAEAGQSYFPETEMYQKTIQKLQGHWVDKNGNVLDFNILSTFSIINHFGVTPHTKFAYTNVSSARPLFSFLLPAEE